MLAPDKTFGRYTIVREIGRGGMGAVFEARHSQLKKLVALKTMHGAALDHRAIERFLREGRAAASVRHPHIVDVSDVGVEDGTPFLVMELLDGEDLAKRITTAAPLSVEETIDVMLPVIDAVRAMHERGIVHRDLKPENIFLSRGLGGELVPKVLDFGVCREDSDDARKLTEGAIVGTPFYLSPEQVDGARGDPRSDQHALGVILYECLSGQRPYDAPTLLGLLAAIRDSKRVPLGARRGDLAPAVIDTVERAMASSPEQRFDSVEELSLALLAFASDRTRARWEPVLHRRGATADAPPTNISPSERLEAPRDELPAAATMRQGSPEPHTTEEQPASRGRDAASNRTLVWPIVAASVIVVTVVAATLRARSSTDVARATPTSPPPISSPSAPVTAVRTARSDSEIPSVSQTPASVAARDDAAVPDTRPGRAVVDRRTRARTRGELPSAPNVVTPTSSAPSRAVNDAPIVD